jgi:hypothetical protein
LFQLAKLSRKCTNVGPSNPVGVKEPVRRVGEALDWLLFDISGCLEPLPLTIFILHDLEGLSFPDLFRLNRPPSLVNVAKGALHAAKDSAGIIG